MLTSVLCFVQKANYLEAAATSVDLQKKTIQCSYTKPFIGSQFEKTRSFEIPYDVLVVSVSPQRKKTLRVYAVPASGQMYTAALLRQGVESGRAGAGLYATTRGFRFSKNSS